jgi:hypothetical protein
MFVNNEIQQHILGLNIEGGHLEKFLSSPYMVKVEKENPQTVE